MSNRVFDYYFPAATNAGMEPSEPPSLSTLIFDKLHREIEGELMDPC